MMLHRVLRSLSLLSVAIVVSGCSSLNVSSLNPLNWFAEDKRPKMATLPEYKETTKLTVVWQG